MRHFIIFLDIDGVMIAYPEGGSTNPVFTPWCVEAFRMILTAFPTAKVVFSTTWRLPNYVNRLHERWLEANPSATRWVVLDDDRMAIEEILDNDRCVFTDPARGLTMGNAEAAIEILGGIRRGMFDAAVKGSC